MKLLNKTWQITLIALLSLSCFILIVLSLYTQSLNTRIADLKVNLQQEQEKLAEQKKTNLEYEQQLIQVSEQQALFSNSVTLLKNELQYLQQQQLATEETAAATTEQLIATKASLQQKLGSLEEISAALSLAKRTIDKQQNTINQIKQKQPSRSISTKGEQLQKVFADAPNAKITKQPDRIELRLPYELLFNATEPRLANDALQWLAPLAEALSQDKNLQMIVISYSDARPITSGLSKNYPTNWELSSARASKIVNELITLGASAQQLTAAGRAVDNINAANTGNASLTRTIEFIINSK